MTKLNLVKASLRDIVTALQAGEITSERLIERYLGKRPLSASFQSRSHVSPFQSDATFADRFQLRSRGTTLKVSTSERLSPLPRLTNVRSGLTKWGIALMVVRRVAVKLDVERKEGKVRGVMHGVPVLIKWDSDSESDPVH